MGLDQRAGRVAKQSSDCISHRCLYFRLEGLSADGMVTLKSDDGDYTFPVKAAGYVKLCDDEDLF